MDSTNFTNYDKPDSRFVKLVKSIFTNYGEVSFWLKRALQLRNTDLRNLEDFSNQNS